MARGQLRKHHRVSKRYPKAQVYKIDTTTAAPWDSAAGQCRDRGEYGQFAKELAASRAGRKAGIGCVPPMNRRGLYARIELREEGIEPNDMAVLYRCTFTLEMQPNSRGATFRSP